MYEETRIIDGYFFDKMIDAEGWLTYASQEEYDELRNYCEKSNITTEDLENIAEKIYAYTEEDLTKEYDCSLAPIMLMLTNCCRTIFTRL